MTPKEREDLARTIARRVLTNAVPYYVATTPHQQERVLADATAQVLEELSRSTLNPKNELPDLR